MLTLHPRSTFNYKSYNERYIQLIKGDPTPIVLLIIYLFFYLENVIMKVCDVPVFFSSVLNSSNLCLAGCFKTITYNFLSIYIYHIILLLSDFIFLIYAFTVLLKKIEKKVTHYSIILFICKTMLK